MKAIETYIIDAIDRDGTTGVENRLSVIVLLQSVLCGQDTDLVFIGRIEMIIEARLIESVDGSTGSRRVSADAFLTPSVFSPENIIFVCVDCIEGYAGSWVGRFKLEE